MGCDYNSNQQIIRISTTLNCLIRDFCAKVKRCLGISVSGNPTLVLNQLGNWILNGNGIPFYYSVTYLELTTLISDSKLIEGAYYLITDFKTRAIIQFTGDLPSGVGNELVQEGELEPLLVQALSNNTLSNEAKSISYPQDKILYRLSPLQSDYDYQVPDSLGVIYYRQDQDLMVSREYDWRNIKFRRWETEPENGDFISILPVADCAYVDYAPFENCTNIHNIQFRNSEFATVFFELPYILDNTVIKDFQNVSTSNIGCFGNTFIGLNDIDQSEFFSNNIESLGNSVIKAQNIIFNSGSLWATFNFIGVNKNSQINSNTIQSLTTVKVSGADTEFTNNTLAKLDSVNAASINNNTGADWIEIACTKLYQNDINTMNTVVIEEVSNNILNNLTIHSNTLSGAKITGNVGNQINNNSSFRIRDNNVTYITNNNDTPDSAQEIELNVGTFIIDCGASIYENNVSTIAGCYNTGVIAANIADSIYDLANTVTNVIGNIANSIANCSNLGSITNNVISEIIYGIQGDGSIVSNNIGQRLDTIEIIGDLVNCTGINLSNVSILNAIKNTTFNGGIDTKTITPTASIQATTPSVVKYDAGLTEFVEETITLGVVTYSSAITS